MDEGDSSTATSSDYAKKAMAAEKLAELSLIDPKRAKREHKHSEDSILKLMESWEPYHFGVLTGIWVCLNSDRLVAENHNGFLDAFFSVLSYVVSVPFYTGFLPILFWIVRLFKESKVTTNSNKITADDLAAHLVDVLVNEGQNSGGKGREISVTGANSSEEANTAPVFPQQDGIHDEYDNAASMAMGGHARVARAHFLVACGTRRYTVSTLTTIVAGS
ncbi:uncharacterized protein A4U43_C10F10600 [Asparagus officinalis]|uniref:Uncharacterized protein n=1 Tax=Asparagus officinalis TaxID=4686 RepID=A0A5P1E576_ASPOF|nr:uncharacterized protein A4U43_C10F10600 [Asparagus officinalis]